MKTSIHSTHLLISWSGRGVLQGRNPSPFFGYWLHRCFILFSCRYHSHIVKIHCSSHFLTSLDHCRYLQVTVDILMTPKLTDFSLIVLHIWYIHFTAASKLLVSDNNSFWKYLILSVPALNIYSVIRNTISSYLLSSFLVEVCWRIYLNLFLLLAKILIFSTSLTIDRKSGCLVTGCLIRYIVYFCSQLLRFFPEIHMWRQIFLLPMSICVCFFFF